jgi:hypothetical protein
MKSKWINKIVKGCKNKLEKQDYHLQIIHNK